MRLTLEKAPEQSSATTKTKLSLCNNKQKKKNGLKVNAIKQSASIVSLMPLDSFLRQLHSDFDSQGFD